MPSDSTSNHVQFNIGLIIKINFFFLKPQHDKVGIEVKTVNMGENG